MADAYFSTATMTDLTKAAYNQFADNALRPALIFRDLAKIKPTRQTQPGATVAFTFYDDFAPQTTELNEITDPELINVDTDPITVTLREYGAAAATTRKLRATTFIPGIDRDVAELIGYNGGLSYDTLVRNVAQAGTNVVYAGTAADRDEVSANENITAAKVRYAVAQMRINNAVPLVGDRYLAFIHPASSYDLRTETGAAAWVEPANYANDAAKRWAGMIGAFEGAMFVEANRAPLFENAGDGSGSTGNIDVYGTLFMGKQALAMAHGTVDGLGEYPSFVIGPETDIFRRRHTFGWYWFGGFGIYRQEAILRLESASTIGANT